MNELAVVFDKMGIDINEMVDDMNKKGMLSGYILVWSVDTTLEYEDERLGYHSQIIFNSGVVNDCKIVGACLLLIKL